MFGQLINVNIMSSNSLTLLLGIIAIVCPIVIAYFQSVRKKFFFITKDYLNLYNDISKNSSRLKIAFDNIEVKNNLFFISGILFYKANQDISIENIKKHITFKIGENSKQKEFTIKKKSEDLEIIIKKEETSVELICNLFKKNEYVFIEGIYESEQQILDVSFRIKDVPSIKYESRNSMIASKSSLFVYGIPMIFFFFLIFMLNPTEVFESNLKTQYFINDKENSFFHALDSLERTKMIVRGIEDNIFFEKKFALVKKIDSIKNDNKSVPANLFDSLDLKDPKDTFIYKNILLSEIEHEKKDSIIKSSNLISLFKLNDSKKYIIDKKIYFKLSYEYDILKLCLLGIMLLMFTYLFYFFVKNLFYYFSRIKLYQIIKEEKK